MSNLDFSSSEYFTECEDIAKTIAQECVTEAEGNRPDAEDLVHDKLHEAIDGHQWIIYYSANDCVLRHTSNDEAWTNCYGAEDIGKLVIEKGMDGARTVQAFFAMEADVREYLSDAMESAVANWQKPKRARKSKAKG